MANITTNDKTILATLKEIGKMKRNEQISAFERKTINPELSLLKIECQLCVS